MKGEKLAVFVFLFGIVLALLMGIFNFNGVSLSPLETKYNVVMIISEDGELLYLSNEYVLNNLQDPLWTSTIPPVLVGKEPLEYYDNAGDQIDLNLNYLNLPLMTDLNYIYSLNIVTNQNRDIYYIIKKSPKFKGFTGSMIRDLDGGDGEEDNNAYGVCDPMDFGVLTFKRAPNYVIDIDLSEYVPFLGALAPPIQMTEENLLGSVANYCKRFTRDGPGYMNPYKTKFEIPLWKSEKEDFKLDLIYGDITGSEETFAGFGLSGGW